MDVAQGTQLQGMTVIHILSLLLFYIFAHKPHPNLAKKTDLRDFVSALDRDIFNRGLRKGALGNLVSCHTGKRRPADEPARRNAMHEFKGHVRI